MESTTLTDKPWLKSYPPDIPAEIKTDNLPTLDQIPVIVAELYPQKPAFANFGTILNFSDLEKLSRLFAGQLSALPGLQAGDRVALMLPNLLQFPIAMYGILRAGMVVVNVNPLYTARELRHQLRDSGAKAIVILENFAHVLEEVLDDTEIEHVIITRIGDLLDFPKSALLNFVLKYVKRAVSAWHINHAIWFKQMLLAAEAPKIVIKPEDLAFLQYTGGTTGLSKGAMLTHANVSANLEQASVWSNGLFEKGSEIAITALPMYHIFSLTANCLFFSMIGGLNVLITNPRDSNSFVKEMSRWRFTFISGVNTLYAALLDTPGFERIDFGGLKLSLGAGMAVTRDVATRWKKVTANPLVEVYGLSETSPAVCMNMESMQAFTGYVGLPIPSTDVVILDRNDNRLSPGEEGELCVKGPQVTRGYWQSPEQTKQLFTDDGYMRTGDYAMLTDDGYVKILDRKKDMIIVSGFNVYANEIEDIVSTHPQVNMVAAIGIEDDKSGERVKLFVVRISDELNENSLIDWCRSHMAGYKVPVRVEFMSELPLSAVGKVLRRELRSKN